MDVIARGIDVSVNQGNIDWKKVKADKNGQFAIIKASYGKKVADNFEINYKNAKSAGVPVGAYCYSYAKTVDGAKAEAEALIKILKGKTFEYPIAFDIEDDSQADLAKATLTEMCKAFCETLEKAGYYVCIYSSKSWVADKLDMAKLSAYDVWVAQYYNRVTYKGVYGMWQYSSTGKVNGISAKVDLDFAYKDYPTIIKKAGLNGFKKTSGSTTTKPTTSKPTATKPKAYTKGEAIKLEKAPLYSSATDKTIRSRKTGKYYIYDGTEINGRYRITLLKSFCGKKPVNVFVTGWVAKKDIK